MNYMKILINVDYTDNTGKFWQDSYLKNKVITVNGDIHKAIAEVIQETDGVVLSYNAKPQTNVYVDDKDGKPKPVGYIYRGKSEIYNRDMTKPQKALFDVWVTLKEVRELEIQEINN